MEDENKNSVSRATVICLAFVGAALVIFGKILYLQFGRGEELRKVANEIEYSTSVLPAYRGQIFADDGRALVSYKPMYSVSFDPTVCKDDVFEDNIKALCDSLSRFPGRYSAKEYENQIRHKRKDKRKSYMISTGGKEFNYVQLNRLKAYPIFSLGRGNGGFVVTTNLRRDYPYGQLLHRTLGEFDAERGRSFGLEDVYDSVLRGCDGFQVYRNLGDSRVAVPSRENREAVDGCDVYTTIDINVQDIADNALRSKLIETRAENGCVIVMEVETGYIKAMVNLGLKDGKYIEDFNYAVAKRMEPGSTMKTASFMALIEKGYLSNLDKKINLNYIAHNGKKQSRNIGGYMATDDHALGEKGNGIATPRDILEQSSNVGTALLVYDAFANKPKEYTDQILAMSLGEKHSLGFKGEKQPDITMPTQRRWSKKSLQTISFGYAIEFTPIQILAFYNAIANGGRMMKPILVNRVEKNGELVAKYDTAAVNPQIASPNTIAKAQELLEGVVKNGTAKNLSNSKKYSVSMAGKTGTAQLYNEAAKSYYWRNEKTGANDRRLYNSTFVGYFPADKPQYSCIVIVSKPRTVVYGGGGVCAPVFGTIAQSIYSTRLGVQAEQYQNMVAGGGKFSNAIVSYEKAVDYCKTFGVEHTASRIGTEWVSVRTVGNGTVDFREAYISEDVMPDVVGMSVTDAVSMLENMGCVVRIKGCGRVASQSVASATPIDKGTVVELQLTKK